MANPVRSLRNFRQKTSRALKPIDTSFGALKLEIRLLRAHLKRKYSKTIAIGVTGSSAKSTTAALVSHILAERNTDRVIFKNQIQNIYPKILNMKPDTEFFVCEVALGKRPMIGKITRFLQPDVAITTMIGIEHYSVYRSREAILAEKGKLTQGIRSGGFAVINADDASCEALKAKTAERIVTFGKEKPADYRVTDTRFSENLELSLTIEGPQGAAELETRLVGEHFWLSTAAAYATCTELGIDRETIRRRIASFASLDTRCQMFETRSGPDFILDTAKAPEETLPLSFDILKLARNRKTRIVLGHISDYTNKSRRIYRKAYRVASKCTDQVIFVGERSHRSGASPEDHASERFVAFETPLQAFEYLRENAGKDDLLLLKSSRNQHLERIAFAFERDVKCWVPVCTVRESCEVCGLWNIPYEEHYGENWHRDKGSPD